MEKTLEIFIYDTLKPNTNSLKSTEFYVVGIKRKISTKQKVKEAMSLKLKLIKTCKVTGNKYFPDYENFNWVKI